MKGVIGCGKSTWSTTIKNKVEARGGVCLIVGTDKYCKQNMSISQAIAAATQELLTIKNINNDDLVVIIDTCGEHYQNTNSKIFELNFSSWTHIVLWPNLIRNELHKYLAWSLFNVLSRTHAPSVNDNYCLWNNYAILCIKIHKKKTSLLFNNDRDWKFQQATIANLSNKAQVYKETIKNMIIPDI